ncbi:hypothetical protein [Ralstonia mannitolilytica]|uniref:hypothetical protein n=1 Tax=Ralstonia mannitolilytica TaxID=105219 RepID=UPI0028F6A9D3|nr:hypothetical protein [Ralstonia mannitolilytica]CAJ0740783.1 hypothetical protein R76696_03138 [Ralstonia mannitolilytica]
MSRSRVSLSVNVLTGLLAAVGVAFFVYTLFAHVDLASVRTGALVFYAGVALALAALLAVIQLPLVLFALVCRPAIRARIGLTFLSGIVVFVACYMCKHPVNPS